MIRLLGLTAVAVLLAACDGQIGGLAGGSDEPSSLSGGSGVPGPDEPRVPQNPDDPTPNEPGVPNQPDQPSEPPPAAPAPPPSAPKTPIPTEPPPTEPPPSTPSPPSAPKIPEEPPRDPAPGVTETFYVTRTTCMRPCAVQFDVQAGASLSWSEVRDSEFVWDFDDGGSRTDAEGFLAAVVYEEAGTYQPTVTVDGETWNPQTITVTEPNEVACVSPVSDWTNCPAGAEEYTSISAAMAGTGANSHILLEGNRTHGSLPNSGEDNILFGAYDTGGGNPRVSAPGGSPKRGWAYQDLTITGSGPLFGASQPNLLWHRVSAPSGQRFLSTVYDTTGAFIIDSNVTGAAYTMFVGSSSCDRLVIKNTVLQSTDSGQHVARVQDCDRILIQDSQFLRAGGTRTSLTVRGNSEWGLIQGNYSDKEMTISAANATSNTTRRWFVWERNHVELAEGGVPNVMRVRSTQNAVFRNNILHGHGSQTGIKAEGGQIQSNANLVLVNNTYYDIPSHEAHVVTCDGANCVAKNNLAIASPTSTSPCVTGSGDISNNWCYTTTAQSWCLDPVTGGSSCHDPRVESTTHGNSNFMRPAAGTRGVDAGSNSVPVWNDYGGGDRTMVDVGAIER